MSKVPLLIGAALLAAGLGAATVPWRLARSNLAEAIVGGSTWGKGLVATIDGPVTFKLLPRPRIQATELILATEDGAVRVDAPLMKAELDIPSLLRGSWRLSSATLVGPTVTLDLDRLTAMTNGKVTDGEDPSSPLRLNVRSGLLKTRSSTPLADLLATGLDASFVWPAAGNSLVVSGGATWRGTAIRFTGDLQHVRQSLTPVGSAASLKVESALFSLSANGTLSGGGQEQFVGHTTLITPALPKLLRVFDGVPFAPGARRAEISGDLVAKPHDLSLSNAEFRLDQARFEGTLAWRRDAGRGLLVGTLATDLLDVDALARGGFDRRGLDALYGRPLNSPPFGTDVDMRISASTARMGALSVGDVAGAVLVSGDRLELSLDEASGYGGVVKARAVATLGPDGIEAHADLSAAGLDLTYLSEALHGDDRVGGTITGHAVLDGRGASLRDVVAKLAGQGQVAIDGGRLAGLSVDQLLRRLGRRVPLAVDRQATPTTFDHARWDVAVADGIVRIPDGTLTAPGVAMTFGAEADLPDGRVDVHAVAAQTDSGGRPLRNGQRMPFDMRGTWTGPLVLVGRGLPSFGIPLLDGSAAAR